MPKIPIDTVIFDFDSTLLQGELLEVIASLALAHRHDREEVLSQLREITNLGMEGRISFGESLSRRLKLLNFSEAVLQEATAVATGLLNPQYLGLIPQLRDKRVYVVSGGYKNVLDTMAEALSVDRSHIFAIELFFKDGQFSHYDSDSLLVCPMGKAMVANSIPSKGRTLMVGDGMTDYEVKQFGGAHYFAAYTGVAQRDAVCAKADFVLSDLGDLFQHIE